MKVRVALLGLVPVAAFAAAPVHFDLQASFVPPAKLGANGAVAVLFTPRDPDVHVNEAPAPRLKLAADQAVLIDKQLPAAHAEEPPAEPGQARYLDLGAPVRFAVALAPGVAKGQHMVKGSLTYFYCSKKAGWCRKGTSEVEIPVVVR